MERVKKGRNMKVKVLLGTAIVLAGIWGSLAVDALQTKDTQDKVVHTEAIETPPETVTEPVYEVIETEPIESPKLQRKVQAKAVEQPTEPKVPEWKVFLDNVATSERGRQVIQCLENYHGTEANAKTRTGRWNSFSDDEKNNNVRSFYAQTLLLIEGSNKSFVESNC